MTVVYGIRFVQQAGTVVHADGPVGGQWLESYNPEAFNGRGLACWTNDPEKAMQFPTSRMAFTCWRMTPRNRPRRPDGHPNRPLTAFTIAIEPLPEGGQ